MTLGHIPLCESCSRLEANPNGYGYVCAAFPNGIPDEIYVDGFDHRQAFDGDGGVRYEQSTEAGAAEALAAYEQDTAAK